MRWIDALASLPQNLPVTDHEVSIEFERLYAKRESDCNRNSIASASSFVIPRFYFKNRLETSQSEQNSHDTNSINTLKSVDVSLSVELQKVARQRYIERRIKQIPSLEDIGALAELINTSLDHSRTINFETLRDVGVTWCEYYLKPEKQNTPLTLLFFSAQSFSKLRRNKLGEVNADLFLQYVDEYIELYSLALELNKHDMDGDGYLKETEMDTYILNLTLYLPELERLGEEFRRFYVCAFSS